MLSGCVIVVIFSVLGIMINRNKIIEFFNCLWILCILWLVNDLDKIGMIVMVIVDVNDIMIIINLFVLNVK